MDQAVAFISLFLGLITGPQEIRLNVSDQVASVELLLDGQRLGVLDGEPWALPWDAGEVPWPHRLEAVARTAEGEEAGRAEQWINLPRPAAEVEVVLSGNRESGEYRAALSWQSLSEGDPLWVRAELDEGPIEEPSLSGFELPKLDMSALHILRVEIGFPEEITATRELVFGGIYLDRAQADLTALVAALDPRTDESDLQGRVLADGQTARVVAIESGPIHLIVVRDRAAVAGLREYLQREAQTMRRTNKSLTGVSTEVRLKRLQPLPARARLSFVWPAEDQALAARKFDLFPRSQWLDNRNGGLAYLTALMTPPPELVESQRLADAVAVAGMSAARRNSRRAVLLILGPDPEDNSALAAGAARQYLEALGVPLFVWRTSDAAPEGWGKAADITSPSRFRRAATDLWNALKTQRLIWVEGRHLPQQLVLGPKR